MIIKGRSFFATIFISSVLLVIHAKSALAFQNGVAVASPYRHLTSAIQNKCANDAGFKTMRLNSVDTSSSSMLLLYSSKSMSNVKSTQLFTVANPSLVTSILRSSIMTKLIAALTFFLSAFTIKQIQKHGLQSILWPNSGKDPASVEEEPLPPGPLGCPLFGNLHMFNGSRKDGPGTFWRSTFRKYGFAQVFKTYLLGRPIAIISGHTNIKNVFEQEFKPSGISTQTMENVIMGSESVLGAQTQKEHSFLRNLVGMAMTNPNVDKGLPLLEQSAMTAINKMIGKASRGENIKMEDVCTEFTLDVAWRQILGLNLKEEEVHEFSLKVNKWVFGVINPLLMFLPQALTKHTKSFKAKQ